MTNKQNPHLSRCRRPLSSSPQQHQPLEPSATAAWLKLLLQPLLLSLLLYRS